MTNLNTDHLSPSLLFMPQILFEIHNAQHDQTDYYPTRTSCKISPMSAPARAFSIGIVYSPSSPQMYPFYNVFLASTTSSINTWLAKLCVLERTYRRVLYEETTNYKSREAPSLTPESVVAGQIHKSGKLQSEPTAGESILYCRLIGWLWRDLSP